MFAELRAFFLLMARMRTMLCSNVCVLLCSTCRRHSEGERLGKVILRIVIRNVGMSCIAVVYVCRVF